MEKSTEIFTIIKIPRKGCHCICLSVILIDSVYRKDKSYYPQVFFEECKYVVKQKKMSKSITDNIEVSSDDILQKNMSFLSLGLESSISRNITKTFFENKKIRNSFRAGFIFNFSSLG